MKQYEQWELRITFSTDADIVTESVVLATFDEGTGDYYVEDLFR